MILGTNKWSENAVLFLHETFHHSDLGWVHVAHPGLWIFEPAAAAAKSCQSCLTVWPHRWQPTRLRHPWDSPGKDTGVGCHFLLQSMKVKSESEVAQSCLTLSNPMLPGSSVHGISQSRVLEWGAIALSLIEPRYLYSGNRKITLNGTNPIASGIWCGYHWNYVIILSY